MVVADNRVYANTHTSNNSKNISSFILFHSTLVWLCRNVDCNAVTPYPLLVLASWFLNLCCFIIFLSVFLIFIQNQRSGYHKGRDYCTHCSVDPVGWWVFGIFDSQFNNSLPLQQTWAGAHGEASNLLHIRDKEIHPADTQQQNTAFNHSVYWLFTLADVWTWSIDCFTDFIVT